MAQVVTKDDMAPYVPQDPGISVEGYTLQGPPLVPPEPPFWVKWIDQFTLEMLLQRHINWAACRICDQLVANDTLMHRIRASPYLATASRVT